MDIAAPLFMTKLEQFGKMSGSSQGFGFYSFFLVEHALQSVMRSMGA